MTGRKTRNRSGPTARAARVGPARLLATLATVLLWGATPGVAQEACDETMGTLGIRGLRCEGCTYSMTREGITEARFRTEPQVLAVWLGLPDGDRLRAGDRIVAIDGALITTREGGRALVDLRTGQEVAVRVRRDGRVVDLEMVAASACDLDRRLTRMEAELQVLDPMPEGYNAFELPPPPPAEAPPTDAPRPAPPAMPATPAMPPMPPNGYLGFGLRCGACGIREGGVLFFGNPPTVTGVAEGSPAEKAGIEPDDVILAVDGLDITTDQGGERFREIEPGDRVELTLRRGDGRRTVTVEAGERVARRVTPGAMPAQAAPSVRHRWRVRPDTLAFDDQPLTFEEAPLYIEDADGEVVIILRDAPITIEKDEATGELVISSGGRVIRMTRTGG